MWIWLVFCLGLVAGGGIGYRHASKKAASVIEFVPKRCEEKVLRELHIQIGKDSVCSICGDLITMGNLGAILKIKSGRIFFCSKSQCMTLASISPDKREMLITRRPV